MLAPLFVVLLRSVRGYELIVAYYVESCQEENSKFPKLFFADPNIALDFLKVRWYDVSGR